MVELILPSIRFEVAVHVLEFIYTGQVFCRLHPRALMTAQLALAAADLKLTRLMAMCRSALFSADSINEEENEDEERTEEQGPRASAEELRRAIMAVTEGMEEENLDDSDSDGGEYGLLLSTIRLEFTT